MTIKHIMKQRCRFHNIQTLMILLLCDIREEGKLLRADMPDDECEKMKAELEKCGAVCKLECENWGNFDDVAPPQ